MARYLPHHRDNDVDDCDASDGFWKTVAACFALVIIIGLLCLFGVEAWFKEDENQERYYSKPVEVPNTPAAATYKKPAAYRLQSPTPEQMEKLHDLQKVAEVNK